MSISSSKSSTAASFPSSVTFRDDSSLTTIREFDKVEGFDRPHIWWTPVDYTRFRSSIYRAVEAMRGDSKASGVLPQEQKEVRQEQGEDTDSWLCLRGLENYTSKERRRQRRDRIHSAVCLVLDEQESNFEDGINDGFSFADKYQQYTASTLVQAQARGLQDELEARRYNTSNNVDQISRNKRMRAVNARKKWGTLSVLGRYTIRHLAPRKM